MDLQEIHFVIYEGRLTKLLIIFFNKMKESRLIFKELPDLSNSEMGRLLRDSNSNPETRISSNASENLPDDFNDSLLTEISIVAEKISTFVSDLLSHPEFFENEAAQG